MANRLCIVRHDIYRNDIRIENQLKGMQEVGFETDFICIREPGQPLLEKDEKDWVIRLPALQRARGSLLLYILEYGTFLVTVMFALGILQLVRRYQFVHICNLPDFLVYSALVPKLAGAKICLDMRESMPEMFAVNQRNGMQSNVVKFLIWLQQRCISFSNVVVTCTEPMKEAMVKHGANTDKIFVMMNVVDDEIFHSPQLPTGERGVDESFRIVTHGSLTPRYGLDVLIKAMAIVHKAVPKAHLQIIGAGQLRADLEALVSTLELTDCITFTGFMPITETADRLREAHCGVVSMVSNYETELVHTFKMQEYMSLGIPVVISRLLAITEYYSDEAVCFAEPGNPQDLATAILKLHQAPLYCRSLAQNALKACAAYSPARQKRIYSEHILQVLAHDRVLDATSV